MAYIDDILIYSKTLKEHVVYISKVLRAFRQYNLRVKVEKCEFYIQKVTFLGYIITPEEISIENEKVERIQF